MGGFGGGTKYSKTCHTYWKDCSSDDKASASLDQKTKGKTRQLDLKKRATVRTTVWHHGSERVISEKSSEGGADKKRQKKSPVLVRKLEGLNKRAANKGGQAQKKKLGWT